MKVLIACARSQMGRREFAARGWDAWSCDLEPAFDGSARHIVCDVRGGILEEDWDLIIAHPPCTRLTRAGRQRLSGAGFWTQPKRLPKGRTYESLLAEFELGVELFKTCWQAPCAHVAVENPVMHDLARERFARELPDLPAPQLVQPFWFAEPAYKETGWYLRGLPALRPTRILPEPARHSLEWREWNAVALAPPGPDRATERSVSFLGMTIAQAEQWTAYLKEAPT